MAQRQISESTTGNENLSDVVNQLNTIGMGNPRLVEVDAPKRERRSPAVRQVKLSIVMPAYNEQRTMAQAIAAVLSTRFPCDFELIVVNDGSSDGTGEILRALRHPKARVIEHAQNRGKGAAVQTGAAAATGTHLVPFDADLEYDPADLVSLVRPVMQGRCEVVYGVRLFGANTRYQSYHHAIGNRMLTFVASVMFNASLSDLHTCLKLVPVELFRKLELRERGFALDTEITAKLLARRLIPFEIPVSYHSRSVAHGKKITWRDGLECLHVLARVRAASRSQRPDPALPDPLDLLASSISALRELTESDDDGDTVLTSDLRLRA